MHILNQQCSCYVWLCSSKKQKIRNTVKSTVKRPTRKQLQRENTDAVWNELTHLQQENKMLKADKYAVLNSLSILTAIFQG